MTLRPPIGPPANPEASQQRRVILGSLSLQNAAQIVVYLIGLGIAVGAVRTSISSTTAETEQNHQDILAQKSAMDQQHDFELKLSAKMDLMLYRLDRLDNHPDRQP